MYPIKILFVSSFVYFYTPAPARPQGGTSISGSRGGLAPNFASEILVGAPNFVSNNINDKYPKFCPLNFRYDPKIGTFSQLLRLLVRELPKFFLLWVNLAGPCPNFASKLDVRSKPPPHDLLIWKYPPGGAARIRR